MASCSVSPDLNKVVLKQETAAGYDLWHLAIENGDLTRITSARSTNPAITWGPMSDRFLCNLDDGTISLVEPLQRNITTVGHGDSPSWSPSGEWVAWSVTIPKQSAMGVGTWIGRLKPAEAGNHARLEAVRRVHLSGPTSSPVPACDILCNLPWLDSNYFLYYDRSTPTAKPVGAKPVYVCDARSGQAVRIGSWRSMTGVIGQLQRRALESRFRRLSRDRASKGNGSQRK